MADPIAEEARRLAAAEWLKPSERYVHLLAKAIRRGHAMEREAVIALCREDAENPPLCRFDSLDLAEKFKAADHHPNGDPAKE